MCYIQTKRGITGNSDTTNTNSPWGTMPWPCPRRSVVKKSGQVSQSRRSKQTSIGGTSQGTNQDQGTHNSARENGSSSLKRGRQGQCHTVSIAGCYTGKCRDYKSCSRQNPGSARRGNPEGNRVTRHVTRHPCIKNPPGGPKASRGTRHTNKNKKNKENNKKIQENHNKKGVYPTTLPTAGWAGPTSS